MLTIKSDDLVGRSAAYRAIIQGLPVPLPSLPESFKLLIRELNGVGLRVEPLKKETGEAEAEKKVGHEEAVANWLAQGGPAPAEAALIVPAAEVEKELAQGAAPVEPEAVKEEKK
jgi:hypothetical protein